MATKVTYISATLPSDEQHAALDAAVADVRRAIGTHQLVIGGTARPGGAGTFDVASPANRDESLGTYAEASAADVADAVAAARAAAHDWSSTPYTERARILQCAADLISYYCDRLVEHHAFQTDQASQTGEDHNTSVLRPYVKLFMREQSRTILP